MAELTVDELTAACRDDAADAGITIRAVLEPVAGPGEPVKPAIYAGARYQVDRRWWGEGEAREIVDAIVIDNVPSQANRCEAALRGLRAPLGLPELIMDLTEIALPPHLPKTLSSFQFPHRNADAYLRDAELDGEPFARTDVGAAVFEATGDAPQALLQWFPQALLYGFWQSHLGKKRSQAKLARSWTSEIVGYRPAALDTRTLGVKGDPLNLSVDDRAQYNEDDLLGGGWDLLIGEAKGATKGKKRDRLSELGHGQVPFSPNEATPAGVSFEAVVQRATVSFASLRRIHAGDGDANSAARALLVALGLVGHVAAFGGAFSLRSGADLRPVDVTWTWLGAGDDEELSIPDLDSLVDLFVGCVEQAEAAGLPVGDAWADEPLVLRPNSALRKAIMATWPLGE